MISVELNIKSQDWRVRCFFASTRYDLHSMDDALEEIDCPDNILDEIHRLVNSNNLDTGFTYSNKILHRSVMVVGLASEPKQYFNSFCHELRHLCDDISSANEIGGSGEHVAYLTGEIAQYLFPYFHPLICCQRLHIHD